jgi:hypothetical protein
MRDELAVVAVGASLLGLLAWGFRVLPRERWQILATIPVFKERDGEWRGVNLTYYGFLSATAYVLSVLALLVLSAAAGMEPMAVIPPAVLILAICVPASRIVARLVEGKPCTFTVAGAFFVGLILAPMVVLLCRFIYDDFGWGTIRVMPLLAAIAIAYALGEGFGRLACVSFGCCYGKPLQDVSPWLRALFSRFHFIFVGSTKKIAYASGLDGEKVLPIQALTAFVHVITVLVCTLLFLHSQFVAALICAIVITQLWRAGSEGLRADYRGDRKFSVYQWMSIASAVTVLAVGSLPFDVEAVEVSLRAGASVLWNPIVMIFAELLWFVIFIFTGRSQVIEASVALRICRHRI